MQILFVADEYPPTTAAVVAGLRQREHHVQVLTARLPGQAAHAADEVYDDLTVEARRTPQLWQFFAQRRRWEQRNAAHLQQRLAHFKPDVVLMWNVTRLSRRVLWTAEQASTTPVVYYVTDTAPVQPDVYAAYWANFAQRHLSAPGQFISRLALRQLRLENPGILRLDWVICATAEARRHMCATGLLPDEAVVVRADLPLEPRLAAIDGMLQQTQARPRLGAPLPPAPTRPLIDLKRWTRRAVQPSPDWSARLDDAQHLALAAQWLGVAQDRSGNGGLAQLYDTDKREWAPAYPETTGYAIPTLLHYARLTGDETLLDRVRRMADYLLSVQLINGAVPIVNNEMFRAVQPCAFDVGQVIYGYLAAYQAFAQPAFLEAAHRAGDWLIRDQEPDGSWVRLTYYQVAHAWEVRVSWALLQLAQLSGAAQYKEAAQRNLAWTCAQQQADGWFEHLALVPGEAAVMHTIAYTLEGMLECGVHLGDSGSLQAVRRAADVLLAEQRPDGSLPGAFNTGWRSVDDFTCLTGNAQMALVWQRLYQLSGEEPYRAAAEHIIDHVCRAQWTRTSDRDLQGAVPGSAPLGGAYLPHSLPNWAAKFFMDALLLKQALHQGGRSTTPPPR
jgi:hypothetical protein